MNEPFILAVTYHGSDLEFKARFERWGYTHRIAVLIDEDTLVFEPDEEGIYRVLVPDQESLLRPDIALLQVITEKLASLIK